MIFEYEISGASEQEVISEIKPTLELIIGLTNEHDIKPCHTSNLRVRVDVSGPFFNTIAGNIKCSCGKAIAIINGQLGRNLLIKKSSIS